MIVRHRNRAARSNARAVCASRWVEPNSEGTILNSSDLPGPTIAPEVNQRLPAPHHLYTFRIHAPCYRAAAHARFRIKGLAPEGKMRDLLQN